MALAETVPDLTEIEVRAAEGALRVYGDYPRGSSPRQITRMMTRLALAYPNMRISDEEAAARIELYADMLGDIDHDILQAGFRAAVQSSKFFPSVSELRDMALKQPATPRMIRQHRLRAIVAAHHAQPNPIDVATHEQIAAVKAEMGLSDGACALLERIVGSEAA